MSPSRRWLLALGLIAACLAPVARAADYAGWTLEAALLDLRAQGLVLVWSTDTVTPGLKVVKPVAASTPVAALRELLAPHRLEAREEGGAWIVVRAPRPSPARSTPDGEDPAVFRLDPVAVGASRYRLLGGGTQGGEFLGRAEVDRLPHLANDPFRAVAALPGFAAGDISARFNVRGGEFDEALVLLDGMTIHEPFHLKNILSALSIIETRALAGIDVMTGGFPARYGDRMSAVLDMTSVAAAERTADSFGVSFLNAHLLGAGGDSDAGWLASARRGYVDVITRFIDTGGALGPEYYDFYGKTSHAVGEASTLSLHLLFAHDDEQFEDFDDDDTMSGAYGNLHAWARLVTDWTPAVRGTAMAYLGGFDRERLGELQDSSRLGFIDDRREVDFHGLSQQLEVTTGAGHVFDFGVEARSFAARYRYRADLVLDDPTETGPPVIVARDEREAPEGHAFAAWFGSTWRLAPDFTASLGARWDRQTWTGIDDDWQGSPRAALGWAASDATTLRLAWGRYAQAQGVHELEIEDDVDEFAPAERAEHRIVGLDHDFGRGLTLRVEAYDKRYTELRPRYENLLDPVDLFAETLFDRVRIAPESARARGVELSLRRVGEGGFDWWLYHAWSRATDRIDGRDAPRSWDQPRVAYAGFDWHPGRRWSLSLNGKYRSGWPTTEYTAEERPAPGGGTQVVLVQGQYNGRRLGPTVTFNLRATRETALENGRLRWYLEVFNLLDRENPCCGADFFVFQNPDTSYTAVRDIEPWLPLIPSFGVLWEF